MSLKNILKKCEECKEGEWIRIIFDSKEEKIIKILSDYLVNPNAIALDTSCNRVFNKKYLLLIEYSFIGYLAKFETIDNIRFELDETVSGIEDDISELETEKNAYTGRIEKLIRRVE